MSRILGEYKNGNFITRIFSNGTMVRKTDDNQFIPEFASGIDIKITDKCSGTNCVWCHEGSSPGGRHGNIMGERFVDTLKPWQEVALGGGNVLEHPSLIPFLRKLKFRNVIANITVNQYHFEANQELIRQLADEKLIYGLGVSLMNPTGEFIEHMKQYPNAVVHVINGIVQGNQINKLKDHDLKLLILGYKQLRRGNMYYDKEENLIRQRMQWLYENIQNVIDSFVVTSFDNLAIEQLDVKRLLKEEEWEHFYMGDDAMFTFYIDMVERKFARNSTAPMSERYTLLDNVTDMFQQAGNNR